MRTFVVELSGSWLIDAQKPESRETRGAAARIPLLKLDSEGVGERECLAGVSVFNSVSDLRNTNRSDEFEALRTREMSRIEMIPYVGITFGEYMQNRVDFGVDHERVFVRSGCRQEISLTTGALYRLLRESVAIKKPSAIKLNGCTNHRFVVIRLKAGAKTSEHNLTRINEGMRFL
jgi:hypothetical protein